MPITIAPTVPRGTVPQLQHYYFSSSLFVEPMREDIANLLTAFTTVYAREPLEPERPFALFKSIWKSEGWDLVHLRVVDPRGRITFLRTVMRLLVERMDPAEHILIRVGALFALYSFYTIQPTHVDNLQSVEYITFTIDAYEQMLAFPGELQPPLKLHVTYIISELLSHKVIELIPPSTLGSHNPRNLPHTMPLLTRDVDYGQKKKTGRPSQLDYSQRSEKALANLETFIAQGSTSNTLNPLPISIQNPPAPDTYITIKRQLKAAVAPEALKAAEDVTMQRIQEAEHHVKAKNLIIGEHDGMERLKEAAMKPDGLLGLVVQRDPSSGND
ncbi:hypothetical protein BU17DRAFT_48010 [Hysterangium stoloniferum]|nr:hypothetical protein BU17DRAFT_48010 [Hysterangium stoloniferum]